MSENNGNATKQDLMDMTQHILHEMGMRFEHVDTRLASIDTRLKKTESNVATCLELLTRQSRWHSDTDTNALELLKRVNALEKRVSDLEGGKAA